MTAILHEGKSGPRSQNSLQEALGAAPDDQKALDVQRALPIRIKFSLPTVRALADPAVGFGGGQLSEVTQARIPPKLKSSRIWPTIFWGVAQNHVQK